MWIAAIWLATVLAGPRVEGNARCPAPEEVARQLRPLLPEASEADGDVVRLDEVEGGFRITLRGPEGSTIGERVLERAFPCADLAAAAALVVATWESDVHPEFAARLEGAAAAPPGRAGASAASVPAVEPTPAAEPAPPPVAPALRAVRVSAPASPPGAPSSWSLGVGAVAALAPGAAGSGAAAGLRVEGTWLGARGRVGARLGFAGTTSRQLALTSGDVDWRRVSAGAGPVLRLTSGASPLAVDLHADALLAWLAVQGNGFASNHAADALDVGVGIGGRLVVGRGRWRPWLELGALAWPRPQVVFEEPSLRSAEVPRWEAVLALGVSLWRVR